jgi:hypothetical protein
MIKNYKSFLKDSILEAKVNKVKRENLNVGDYVMTCGEFDGVNLEYQMGRILKVGPYGNILVEFEESFSKNFHAGFKDIGKKGHCFYVPLDNIASNNREEFEKIIKKVGEEQKNKGKRLNATYKDGDVVVGIGVLKRGGGYGGGREIKINIDGEVGIIYYSFGRGCVNPEDRNEKNNEIFWVGFLDRFDEQYMNQDQDGLPKNRAGLQVDKIHMRLATEEEKEQVKDKLNPYLKEIESLKIEFKPGDVVIADGNYQGLEMKNEMGIVRTVRNPYGAGRGRNQYGVQFLNKFNDYLYDVDYLLGDKTGYILTKAYLRLATDEEKEKVGVELKRLKAQIDEFNHPYKKGDYVITSGEMQGVVLDGQVGIVRDIRGESPRDQFTVEFIVNFSQGLTKIGKYSNCLTVGRANLSRPREDDNIPDLIKKLEDNEIMPFKCSNPLAMLLSRINFKLKSPFMAQSYFDVTDKNDAISYLPLDKFKRLEKREDPYKSRLRQATKLGKFFRMLNKDLTDKEVEALGNAFKGAFDICISGLSDKLRLVSGEDMRFWYNGKNYVHGGGSLNSSCMQGDNKGREMQMFVDNPGVIQMLILLDSNLKLLARANVWRLVEPYGATYMEYIYCRHEKDRELFLMYAKQRGWICGDGVGGRYSGNRPSNMVCLLTRRDKKYQMGRDALDHFDTFRLHDGDGYQYCSNNSWKMPKDFVMPTWDDIPKGKTPEPKPSSDPTEPVKPIAGKAGPNAVVFKEGDKVVYKHPGKENDGKTGVFVGYRDDGKYRIKFDGVDKKFAANPKNIFPNLDVKPEGVKPEEIKPEEKPEENV